MVSNRVSPTITAPFVALVLLAPGWDWSVAAADTNLVRIEVSLSNDSIHPGEPLELLIGVTREFDDGSGESVKSVEIDATKLLVTVVDPDGSTKCDSFAPVPLIGGLGEARHLLSFDFRSGDSETIQRCFQEWCSTELPKGKYTVRCDLSSIRLIVVSEDARRGVTVPMADEWEFPLEVLERDDEFVKSEYARWEQIAVSGSEAKEPLLHDSPENHAIEMIVYAKTPLALPFQIRLLANDNPLRFNHIFDLATHLVSHPSAELAKELLGILDSDRDIGHPWKNMVISWMVFKLYETGDPAIMEITREYVQSHKRPIDPDKGAP